MTQVIDSNSTAIEAIKAGKPELQKYIPEGESPKVYIDLVKSQIMGVDRSGNPRPDTDLLYFLYVAKRAGLDPLVKQIYAIYRWDYQTGKEKMSIQVGVDGMRVVAQRTGQYAGSNDPVFQEDLATGLPKMATVTVKKNINGVITDTVASARWSEYAQMDKNGLPLLKWKTMPYLMLGKCAESLALRKAFPNELSGLYTPEEMDRSNNVLADLPPVVKEVVGREKVKLSSIKK